MVGTIKNIVVAFDFCTSPSHDQVDPDRHITGLSCDMSSGYVLEVFFNLAQFGLGRDLHGPDRDYDFRPWRYFK